MHRKQSEHAAALRACFVLLACTAILRHAPAEEHLVPMRDGVVLATDVHLPARGGPAFPAVLIRSVYPLEGLGSRFIQEFVTRYRVGLAHFGIALVIQETRGKGRSDGEDPLSGGDVPAMFTDTEDTLAWIRSQEWSNGRIASAGQSAWGITQVLMPARCQAELQCLAVSFCPSCFYGEASYQGGVFREGLVRSWMVVNASPAAFEIWKAHPLQDDFWGPFDAATHLPAEPVPALFIGGWFDAFSEGTLRNFRLRGGGRSGQKLIMGAFGHLLSARLGDLTLKQNFLLDLLRAEMYWLDHWLNGTKNGVESEPAVRYYTLGDVEAEDAPGNEWRSAADWPPFETEETPWFLGTDGFLRSAAPSEQAGNRTFVHDPRHPVPSCRTETNALLGLALTRLPFDQSWLTGRPDVLRFATAPLDRPVEATGKVMVRLFVSSDAPDTDFAARLVDVYPDGREILMLDGIRRLRFRNGFERSEAVAPGIIVPLEIDLGSISLVFARSHRVGLFIASSSYPRFAVNPNTGDDFLDGCEPRLARNTVHMSEKHPSALFLPLRP
ncbi:MAG: CocE/NonD family hydrolase [Planctomycetes bacterium]|nr:CocE/NonD family hydrolase [Planctomycetota bacterium]